MPTLAADRRSLVLSVVVGSAILAAGHVRAQPTQGSTQVVRSPAVTPATPPTQGSTQVVRSSVVTPAASAQNGMALAAEPVSPDVRRGALRAWFAVDSVRTSPCVRSACVDRWDNKADPKNPARANQSFRPTLESFGGRTGVRFGLAQFPDGLAPMPTPLTFDASWLAGRPYTVIAVVSRTLWKDESYFFGTTARNCGLLGCEANTGLHIGWRRNDTLTVDPYGSGLDLRVPAYAPSRLALVTATGGHGQVRLKIEEAGAQAETSRASFTPLVHANTGMIGMGAHYRSDILSTYPTCSAHCYSGYVLELLVYDANLDFDADGTKSDDAERVRAYLRRKHSLFPYVLTQPPSAKKSAR